MHDSLIYPQANVARKSGLTLAAHWLSALAVALAFGLVWLREALDDDAVGTRLLTWHRQLGLLVLLLLALRLLARWRQPSRELALPALLHWASQATQWLFYLLLLAMPLLGWAMTSAQGHALQLFNLAPLPALLAVDPDLADSLQEWHELGASCLLGLIALHVLAALWHHAIRRDGVLASMLPLLRPRAPRRFDH